MRPEIYSLFFVRSPFNPYHYWAMFIIKEISRMRNITYFFIA